MTYKITKWPEVLRDPEALRRLYGKPLLGLDLEWGEDERPTILGLSDGELSVSVPYADGKPYLIELLQQYPNTTIVGHNVIGSDLFVLEGEGIKLKLENMEDTILWFWLTNMNLCKTSNKSSVSGEEGERRGSGFMNLGTFCSLYTSLPFWKECRGKFCEKVVCPKHDAFGYNGVDAAGPVIALPKVKQLAALRDVAKLYPMHRELAYVLADMSRVGVMTDVPYANQMREEFKHDKGKLEEEINALGFNPNSDKQVIEHFKKHSIKLDDNKEETIREAVDDYPEDDDLNLLLEYKELGKGIDSWFAPRHRNDEGNMVGYVERDGRIHPQLGFYTSSARLMCKRPNLQNVAKRRIDRRHCTCGHGKFPMHPDGTGACSACGDVNLCKKFTGESVGKKVRRCIIAPYGHYIIRADYKNAENRNFLYMAGIEVPDEDFHTWMVRNIGIDGDHPFALKMGGARDAAKSVTHAADYGEGLSLKYPSELKGRTIKREVEAGARLVFPEWTFNGKVVTFTGINLARRAFGTASLENRRLVLDITNRYFARFPELRDLQQRITMQVEKEHIVRPPHGYALLSYGYDEDRIKQALAVYGSQPVAHVSKLALLDIHRKFKAGRPLYGVLQIHDEVLAYVPDSVEPVTAAGWLRESMEIETPEMPGFVIPAEPSYGPTWKDQTKLKG